ncbi:MAG: orotidine 5'-phosphate decarboxylase / HUMPS family protein [Candidatus Aenigmatarchaeota archaeon]
MEPYKSKFIQFLVDSGALKIGGSYKTKSGRYSPYFLNAGAFDDGEKARQVGRYYAEAIKSVVGDKFDLILGIPNKGISLAVATSIALAEMGINRGWTFYRKEAKNYGEATVDKTKDQLPTREQMQKEMLVGSLIPDGSTVLPLDDVLTTSESKREADAVIRRITSGVKMPHGIISADRQEINEDGEIAIEMFAKECGTVYTSIVTAGDIYDYLKENGKLDSPVDIAFMRYFRAWGTPELRKKYNLVGSKLIEGRTVIPACDVPFEDFEPIVEATADNPKIGGYKIPAHAGRKGWERWVEVARKYTNKPLIYDHQKAGTDIPDTAGQFMRDLKASGMDAVILFPQSGPRTQVAWTGEALQQGLTVFVGGEMTHPKYLRSAGGYIADEAPDETYVRAARQGVNHFIVPGNKPERIKHYRELIMAEGVDPVFASPGLVAQGGSISEATKVAGDNWHGIVGRAITEAPDKRAAAKELTSQLY